MTIVAPPTHINPYLVDIRTLLSHYLKNLPTILAHHLQVSIAKTRLAVQYGIEAIILGLHDSHEVPSPSPTLQQAFAKPIHLETLHKIHAEAVVHDFFHSKENSIIKTLSEASQLTQPQSRVALGMTIALTKDYLGHIIQHKKLTDHEYRQWLDLQYFFANANPLSWALPSIPKPTHLTYNDYQAKLGKTATQSFDDGVVKLPNYRWLLELANTIKTHHQNIIILGKSLPMVNTKATPTKTNQSNTNHTDKSKIAIFTAWLAAKKTPLALFGTTLLVVIGLVGWWYLNQPKPESEQSQTTETIPQDVAIVRIDDAENAQKEEASAQSTNAQGSNTQTSSTQGDSDNTSTQK